MLKDDETIYHIILASFVMPVFLAGVLIWFFISYQRKKFQNETDKKDALLREQSLLIEKQQAVEDERTRIASEMHDDLGSGLTTIRYLSDKALTQVKDPGEAEQIQRIAEHSNALVRNMSEIIWAMNSRFDNAESLVGYLRRYAAEYLDEHHKAYTFRLEGKELDQIPFSGERRRNVFLVFKEMLHNTVKYSGASEVMIQVQSGDVFEIHVLEKNAVGFDFDSSIEKGNGLFNIKRRMESIGGHIRFDRRPEGMNIVISLPIQTSPNE